MKKFLAVLLSLVMAFSFCLPAFAEDTTASGGGIGDILGGITLPDVDISGAADTIKQLVGIIINSNGKMDEAVIAEIITLLGKIGSSGKIDMETLLKILNALTKGGNSGGSTPNPDAPAGGSVRSALDALTTEQRDYIAGVIEMYLTTDFDNNDYNDKDGNPAYNPAKVTALINAMSRMDYADIQKVLDELHSSKNAKGEEINPALTDEAYEVLTAEVVRQEEVSKNNAATAARQRLPQVLSTALRASSVRLLRQLRVSSAAEATAEIQTQQPRSQQLLRAALQPQKVRFRRPATLLSSQ